MQKHYWTWNFWKEQANTIEWYNKPEIILSEDDNGYPLWYQDGELNVCYLPWQTHTRWLWRSSGFIYDSPVTQTIRKYTFRSKTEVAKLAGGMQSLGWKKEYSNNLYAYDSHSLCNVACARIGVTHSVVLAVLHHMN
jgi:propionyl-CoA synthetase